MQQCRRDELKYLLRSWQSGEIDERVVHERAERIWRHSIPHVEYHEEDPKSIADEVLSNLEILDWQLITPDDIPAMLEFLNTLPGKEREGWQSWHSYWDSVDMEGRRLALLDNPYYAKSPT